MLHQGQVCRRDLQHGQIRHLQPVLPWNLVCIPGQNLGEVSLFWNLRRLTSKLRSPYVTSVGATQIVPGASVTAPEEACETVIYSGGGFSNVFAMPSYQSSAVATYYKNHKPTYTATQYNNSQTVRGFPDVAANGANYVVAVDGSLSLVYGTSASSPTFGSVITLINEQRVNAGKAAVGFINPTLYANPSILNDITSGGNQGCGTAGFTAVAGWDPVTGLGTPNYGKMLSVFMGLP